MGGESCTVLRLRLMRKLVMSLKCMDISDLVKIAAQKDLHSLISNFELCLQYFGHCPFEQKPNNNQIFKEKDNKIDQ